MTSSTDRAEHSLVPAWPTGLHWPVVGTYLVIVPGNLVGSPLTAGSAEPGIAYCEL
jgi:hypothetical protein